MGSPVTVNKCEFIVLSMCLYLVKCCATSLVICEFCKCVI